MKKFYLLLVSALCLGFASKAEMLEFPIVMNQEVKSAMDTKGWTFYGNNEQVKGTFATFFPNYSSSNPEMYTLGSYNAIWTPCEFQSGNPSNEWVITPQLTIDNDIELLSFDLMAAGITPAISNNCTVYISESGTAKSDFKALQSFSVSGPNVANPEGYITEPVSCNVVLEGYAGKKIYLAFVNENNTKGVVGLQSFYLAPYYIDAANFNKYSHMILKESDETVTMRFSIGIMPPVRCESYSYVFKTSAGYEETGELSKNSVSSALRKINATFNGTMIPVTEENETFSLTVTPQYDGAIPFILNGTFAKGTPELEAVGVMEDVTGAWCGWCPFATAGLAYYRDKYDGKNGNPKAIALAPHSGDIMEIPTSISDYLPSLIDAMNLQGYPAVYLNRNPSAITPTQMPPSMSVLTIGQNLEKIFAAKSYAYATLNKVYISNDGIEASFDVTSSLNTAYAPLRASIVVVEDNVQGNNSNYNQTTYLTMRNGGNLSESVIVNKLGEDWLPYFEPFLNPTNIQGYDYILYNKMQYMDVARALYPNYEGAPVATAAKNETISGTINYTMPSNVMIPENTRMVLLITREGSGEIVAADEISFDQYTFESSVGTIGDDATDINIFTNNGTVVVETSEDAAVEIYGIDGRILLSAKAVAGQNSYSLNDGNRIVIVKVNGRNGARTAKVVI